MSFRILFALTLASLATWQAAHAQEQDAVLCFDTADRVRDGETVADAEKRAAHEGCLRALSATASIVQKYQLQEADFDIMGTRPKP
jgi:putative N-acetylmannosamine-6-phosphate epimerase